MDATAAAGFLDSFFPGPSTPYRPAALLLRLFDAAGALVLDENSDPVEVTVNNDDALWLDADGFEKSSVAVSWGAPTGAWSEPVVGWVAFDAASPATEVYRRRFASSRSVDGASATEFTAVLYVSTYEVP